MYYEVFQSTFVSETYSFSDQSEALIPAEFRVISCIDDKISTSSQSVEVASANALPDLAGKSGGALTSALLEVLQSSNNSTNLKKVLSDVEAKLKAKKLHFVPQFSTSRNIDIETSPFDLSNGTGTKRAILVGINYTNQKGALKSCHQDVESMKKYIEQTLHYPASNIETLMDDGKSKSPTREEIMNALKKVVRDSKAGDSVLFYFSGHSGNLQADKNIYKTANYIPERTLIPVDFGTKEQIRDFNLFHHFVHPILSGVDVTCIMDSCDGGSIIDLPYTYCNDQQSISMEESLQNMSNLAFMYTTGGYELPDMFDGDVKDQIESSTNQSMDALHGIYIDEVRKDGIATVPIATEIDHESLSEYDEYGTTLGIGTSATNGTSFADQSEALIPSVVRMISGCADQQTSADVSNISTVSELPDPAGKSGGALTSILLDVLYTPSKFSSFQKVLLEVRERMSERGLSQIPQLSSSRRLDVVETPLEFSDGDGKKRALLVGINYVGQNGQLRGCQNDVLNVKKYIQEVHGFSGSDIVVLMDDGKNTYPTRENLIKALQKLVKDSKEGDSVFFHYSGHGGLLAPEKNIWKNKNNEFDQTLIPVDHKKNGQIRDFNLFHHFVRPMAKGVTVTCIMDCCHSGSVLDLPYYYRSDSGSNEMEEDMDNMSNLAVLFSAAGFVLPDAFGDNVVQNHVETTTGHKMDDLHGTMSEDFTNESYLLGQSNLSHTEQDISMDPFADEYDEYGYNPYESTTTAYYTATDNYDYSVTNTTAQPQASNTSGAAVSSSAETAGCCDCCGCCGGGGDQPAGNVQPPPIAPEQQQMYRQEDDFADMLSTPLIVMSDY